MFKSGNFKKSLVKEMKHWINDWIGQYVYEIIDVWFVRDAYNEWDVEIEPYWCFKYTTSGFVRKPKIYIDVVKVSKRDLLGMLITINATVKDYEFFFKKMYEE